MYQGKDCESDHDIDREPGKGGMAAKMKMLMQKHYRRFKAMGLSDMEAMQKAKMAVKSAMKAGGDDDSA